MKQWRHTFRHKLLDPEQRILLKQLENLCILFTRKKLVHLLSRVGHTRAVGSYPSKLLEIDPRRVAVSGTRQLVFYRVEMFKNCRQGIALKSQSMN